VIREGFDCVIRVGELKDSGLIARKFKPWRRLTQLLAVVHHGVLRQLFQPDRSAEARKGVIRVGELKDSGLIARKIGTYTLINCASPGYLSRATGVHIVALPAVKIFKPWRRLTQLLAVVHHGVLRTPWCTTASNWVSRRQGLNILTAGSATMCTPVA
jgi:hypothetical protein